MATSKVLSRDRRLEGLNAQQRLFVLELTADPSWDVTSAAQKAGYANPRQAGQKLLKNASIAAFLKKKQKRREERLEVKAEAVLEELACLAFRDIADLCDENGKIMVSNLRDIPERARKCIDSVKQNHSRYRGADGEMVEEVTYELKLVPKLGALELLVKHLGIDRPKDNPEGEEDEAARKVINWDDYYSVQEQAAGDPVNSYIEKVKALADLRNQPEPERPQDPGPKSTLYGTAELLDEDQFVPAED